MILGIHRGRAQHIVSASPAFPVPRGAAAGTYRIQVSAQAPNGSATASTTVTALTRAGTPAPVQPAQTVPTLAGPVAPKPQP